jgi:hypothetical protein
MLGGFSVCITCDTSDLGQNDWTKSIFDKMIGPSQRWNTYQYQITQGNHDMNKYFIGHD